MKKLPIVSDGRANESNFIWYYKFTLCNSIEKSRWYFDGDLYYSFGIRLMIDEKE